MAQDQAESQSPASGNLTIPRHVRLRLAADAMVDPRTIERYFQGLRVRGLGRERIEKALRAAGHLPRAQ